MGNAVTSIKIWEEARETGSDRDKPSEVVVVLAAAGRGRLTFSTPAYKAFVAA